MPKDEYEGLHRMTKEEFECLRKDGYLSAPGEILYANGIPIAIYDPVSPTICQSNQIAYNMADLANANFSALHTEQAARMDDICNHFAHVAYNMAETPYNEPRKEPCAANNAKIEGLLYVPLKTKYTIEDLLPKEDLETLRAIMWASFAYGVVIPFCIMWLICDKLLPFF